MANETVSTVVRLTRWLRGLEYNDIRSAETMQVVPVHVGRQKRPLRGVLVAPDLCLGRDRKFYRIIDDHAIPVPLYLVSEQYSLDTLMQAYKAARRTQPRSKK